jgi:4-amino-4-deoxy-L-arabinose transferase-like glycosyltransferase
LSRWSLLVLAAAVLILFFRLYRLNQVPPEMISDHAEKLLDIWDVLHGETHIFFPRNTGREGLQMYLTAAVIQLFGTGYSFLSLKIGTAIAGLLTLPYLYLLGKELGNRRTGLFAMLFAGIAYWPNVITRVALRFTLYPLFVAPALYYFLRGIRRSNRNDFILAGISLGIGLHGYTPIRILPFILIAAVCLYWLHRRSAGQRQQALWGLGLTGLFAGLLFLPLARFWLDDPLAFGFRTLTRLGSLEQPLPEPALILFLKNLRNALTMFTWSNGEIWPVSLPFRPALDVISGGLFHAGIALLVVRYLRQRNWVDLFLLISIPLLLMPSILSLAFPSENPALNRGAGALVPVFLIVGLALDGLLRGLETSLSPASGKRLAWVIALVLLLFSSFQNFDLVFRQYQRNYALASWNSSEIGAVIRAYTQTLGEEKNAYVVAYPHWVDTRLVGINAGFPTRDFAIWPEHFPDIQAEPPPKLFVISPQDTASLSTLQMQYPNGYLKAYTSKVENKDFWQFFVLPEP